MADRTSIHPSDAVRLTGKLKLDATTSLTGHSVALQLGSGTDWTTVATQAVPTAGAVVFTVRPSVSQTYRLAFAGTATYAPSSSMNVVLTVRAWTAAELSAARRAKVLATAVAQAGKWYRYGSAGPRYFDCSGLTQYAYKSVGRTLPHNANAQRYVGRAISRSQARPGDLIIFMSGGHGYHAAIYAGGGYMWDAPHPGARVGKHKIWSSNIVFRRIV